MRWQNLRLTPALGLALTAFACTDITGTQTEDTVCTAGDLRACLCTGGRDGHQACRYDGSAWSECRCDAVDSSSGPSSGTSGATSGLSSSASGTVSSGSSGTESGATSKETSSSAEVTSSSGEASSSSGEASSSAALTSSSAAGSSSSVETSSSSAVVSSSSAVVSSSSAVVSSSSLTTSSSAAASSSSAAVSSSSAAASSSSAVVSSSSAAASSSSSAAVGACPVTDNPCAVEVADGLDHTLVTLSATANGIQVKNGNGSVKGTLSVGMTRAEVNAIMAKPELVMPTSRLAADPLRVAFCGERIMVSYADKPDAQFNVTGALTDDDIVHRIATLPGFTGHTDTALNHGAAVTAERTAYAAKVRTIKPYAFPGDLQDLYPLSGLAFGWNDTGLTAMSVHRPYTGASATPTPVDQNVDFTALTLGTINSCQFPGGTCTTTVAQVKQQLGQPDTLGITSIQQGFFTIYLTGLSYPNLGVQILAVATSRPGNAAAVDAQKVNFIVLTPPFGGVDPAAGNVGIGSAQVDWDAFAGAGTDGTVFGTPVKTYQWGAQPFAVGFENDGCNTARAAFVFFPYSPLLGS